MHEVEVRRDGENIKILVGRGAAKKTLYENFFLKGKNFSLTGPNGIGKTYLKDWIKDNDVDGLNGWISEKGKKVYICERVLSAPSGKNEEDKLLDFWIPIIADFPDDGILYESFQGQGAEESKEIIRNKDTIIEGMMASKNPYTNIKANVNKILSAYRCLNVEIRLILDEFANLKGAVTPEFFDTFRSIVTNNNNLSVLYISREQLDKIASENQEFSKGIKHLALQGFTAKDKLNYISQYNEHFQNTKGKTIKVNYFLGDAEYYCGMHPASWADLLEKISEMLDSVSQEITQEHIDRVLESEEFRNYIKRSVAKKMYDLMKTAYMDDRQNRTYMQSFYDLFIKEPRDDNKEELEELLLAGYIIKIKKKYIGKNTSQSVSPVICGEDAYLPVSSYCAEQITKLYIEEFPALPAKQDSSGIGYGSLGGTVEDGEKKRANETGTDSSQEKWMQLLAGIYKGIMMMQQQNADRQDELIKKVMEAHQEDLREMRKGMSESAKANGENISQLIKSFGEQNKVNQDIVNKLIDVVTEVTNKNADVVKESLETIKFLNTPSAPSLAVQIEQATKESREAYEQLQKQLEAEQEKAGAKEQELQELRKQKELLEQGSSQNQEEIRQLNKAIQKSEEELRQTKARAEQVESDKLELRVQLEEAKRKLETEATDAWEKLVKERYGNIFDRPLDINHIRTVYAALYVQPSTERTITADDCGITEKQFKDALKVLQMFDFEKRFKIAFFIHELFCDMSRFNLEMDYSVLVMLYSRMYESFLKLQHYRMYQVQLANEQTGDKKPQSGGFYTYADIPYEKLTIAKFSYPVFVNPSYNFSIARRQQLEQEAANRVIALLNNIDNPHKRIVSELWRNERHPASVDKISKIRNDVMHEASAYSETVNNTLISPKEKLKELLEELFAKAAFVNIAKIRDAFELRKNADKQNGIDVAQKICEAAELMEKENLIVTHSNLRLYEKGWTRVQVDGDDKRRFIKNYCLPDRDDEFSMFFEINKEDAVVKEVSVGLCESTGLRFYPVDTVMQQAAVAQKLKALWKKYETQAEAAEEFVEEAAVAKEPEDATNASGQEVTDTVIGTEVIFTKTREPRTNGRSKIFNGIISCDGKDFDAELELDLNTKKLDKKVKGGKAVVRVTSKDGACYKVLYVREVEK